MSPGPRALLISGARVLTDAGSAPRETDVLVEAGKIAALAERIPAAPGTQLVDGSDSLLIPGLVNCHLHSSDALLRGAFPSLPLELWILRAYPILGGEPLPERLIYLRTLLVAIECLKSGTTCLLDDVAEPTVQTLASLGAVFEAYRDAGIRANCSGGAVDRSSLAALTDYREVVPEPLRRELDAAPLTSADAYQRFSEEAVSAFHEPSGRLRYVVAPSAPHWCSDGLLLAAGELAERHRLNCHIHLAETRLQAQTARSRYGHSATAHLEKLGVLGRRTTLAHAIWLEDGDLELIAAAGAAIAHNPTSNQRLGSGIAPVRRFLEAGIPVGLGADNPSASDSLGMPRVMHAAGLLSTLASEDHEDWLTAADLLRAATLGGARCALLEREIGSIEVGKRADLALLDLRHPAFLPRNDLPTQLAFGDCAGAVDTVIVDGRIVVEAGHTLGVDEDAVREELAGYLPLYRRLHSRAESNSTRFAPYVAELLARSRRRAAPPAVATPPPAPGG